MVCGVVFVLAECQGWRLASDPRRWSQALGSDAATNLCRPDGPQPAESTLGVVWQVQTLLAVDPDKPHSPMMSRTDRCGTCKTVHPSLCLRSLPRRCAGAIRCKADKAILLPFLAGNDRHQAPWNPFQCGQACPYRLFSDYHV